MLHNKLNIMSFVQEYTIYFLQGLFNTAIEDKLLDPDDQPYMVLETGFRPAHFPPLLS